MITLAALAFAAGAATLQQQAALPSAAWAWALPFALLAWKWPRAFLVPAAFTAGFLWAAANAHHRMEDRLSPSLEGRDLELTGVVRGLPARNERGTRFEFEVQRPPDGLRLPSRLLLSWYSSREKSEQETQIAPQQAPILVHPGERWRFTVRLRRPHGNVNPGGFDYEAWLLERGIGATGYVRQRPAPQRLGEAGDLSSFIESARESVRERFLRVLGPTPAAGILAALAVGDQHAISAEEWRLFARTGVTHLMSISGLHVTLVSGLLAWLLGALWRRVPALALRIPARKACAVAAVAGALGYSLLAGFAVPAQRTFYMVAVVALALWSGRIASPMRVLALALAAVVLADPWAPLAPGMWLSFGAVFLIFCIGSGWTGREPRLAQWLRVQSAITLGLAPAALLLFGQVSFAGPIANAISIPAVSLVITPLALIAAIVPVDALLQLSAWLVQWLLQLLEWCATLPGALWQSHAPSLWAVALALAGVAWLLAPRGFPWRIAGLALMAPAFVSSAAAPASGEAWVTTLDVGQGLAVLVRTSHRALLYDAGPAFGPEADSGGRIVLPMLRSVGVERLDAMVLTHEDLDHIGGALTVLESIPVDALVSSLPREHPLNAEAASSRPCVAGLAWQWDGVRFEFLYPGAAAAPGSRNNHSCVLRVTTAHAALLLTGDIEAPAEKILLGRPGALKADALVVPHHGSRTSSTVAFIAAVAPRWAVFPVGYRNRFGHPNREVLERYRRAGALTERTDLDGAVRLLMNEHGLEVSVQRAREPRYWRTRPGV
jgi:competence protein ComEC